MAFCQVFTPSTRPRATPRCAVTPPPSPEPPQHPHHAPKSEPLPLARSETSTLLRRMLSIALTEEDFSLAAQIRDAQTHIRSQEPTHALQQRLQSALNRQDFRECARIRNEIDALKMHRTAERAKPKYPMGLVVIHRRLGYRMIIFGVDYRCRAPRRKAEDAGVGLSLRGGEQPWYHAAVDERDKTEGDNIVYVAEDDLCAAGEGVEVRHPITRIMFSGMCRSELCRGYSCYIPGCGDLDDD